MARSKTSSRLLIDDYPLVVSRRLATIIGLNEAVVIQQIHYWVDLFRTSDKRDHYHDGHWWVYNSVRQWREDNFPFWSDDTIRRALQRLLKPFTPLSERDHRIERPALVVSANYNRARYDKTLWYRVLYQELDDTIERYENMEREQIAAERAVALIEREPLFIATAARVEDDFSDLWNEDTASPAKKAGPGYLERMRAQGVADPLALAAEAHARTGGAPSWTVPAAAGGASAYGDVLRAFCAIINYPLRTLPEKKQVDWLKQFQQIAEDHGVESPALMAQAIRVLRQSHTWFLENNVWTSPFSDSFINGMVLVAARLADGQDVTGQDLRGASGDVVQQTAAVGLGETIR